MASSLSHLEASETALLDLAGDDARDVASLSDKEDLILKLYHKSQEQQLEKALLEQRTYWHSGYMLFIVVLTLSSTSCLQNRRPARNLIMTMMSQTRNGNSWRHAPHTRSEGKPS